MAVENNNIIKDHVILAEGADAQFFLIHLLHILSFDNIQVFNFCGVCDLTGYLELFKKFPGYNRVKSIIIARDTEESVHSAVQSINGSLKSNGFITTAVEPFTFEHGQINIGILLFPGFHEDGEICDTGTLEDLCIKIFKFPEIVPYADAYTNDFQKKRSITFKRLHKNKLHAMLSLTDDYVGMKIGETTKAQGFDPGSPYLMPYIRILKEINSLGGIP
jgi:hypothetical protein